VLRVHQEVAAALPDWWIGVNCLGLPGDQVFAQVSAAVAGVWIDDARVVEETEEQPEAERIAAARRASRWEGLYFGGVAFKYQRPVTDYARVARLAARYADVVMTSGPGTGQAADRAKIATMKAALGEVPLAVASGITPENVGEYLDVADCFLVATGISASFTELDPERVAALVRVVRG
jgi:predicted TIM-barrel enzyme